MSVFEWKEIYSVGVPEIDAQHQQLFDIANRFYAAFSAKAGRERLLRIFDELVNYTVTHFADEERLMREYRYPDYDAHKENHEKLIKLVGWYHEQFRRGEPGIEERALEFIKTWLNGHILGMDRKYKPFMTGSS